MDSESDWWREKLVKAVVTCLGFVGDISLGLRSMLMVIFCYYVRLRDEERLNTRKKYHVIRVWPG